MRTSAAVVLLWACVGCDTTVVNQIVSGGDGGDAQRVPGDASSVRDQAVPKTDACKAGAPCTPEDKCHLGAYDCSVGKCVDTNNANKAASGEACGPGSVCDDGSCKPCSTGASCTPADPCHTGTLDCSTGSPTCKDTGTEIKCSTAGETCCGGTCVNEQTDMGNCGGCGLTCNTTCRTGTCLEVIASSQNNPGGLGLDATYVYWSNAAASIAMPTGSICKVPHGGGTVVTLETGQSPTNVAVNASHVYWVDDLLATDAILSAGLSGGTPATLGTGTEEFVSIAIDSTYVYWTSLGGPVGLVPLAGGSVTTLSSASSMYPSTSLGVSGKTLYWANYPAVLAVPVSGGSVTTVVSSGVSVATFDASNVYWYETTGSFLSKPLAGGATKTIVSGYTGGLTTMTTDSASLYGTNDVAGTIVKIPLSGGSVDTLASGQSGAISIAVDATSVYWAARGTSAGEGQILRFTPK